MRDFRSLICRNDDRILPGFGINAWDNWLDLIKNIHKSVQLFEEFSYEKPCPIHNVF